MAENKNLVWIRKHKDILSIGNLEIFIGLPEHTLHRFVTGSRSFPVKHIKILDKKMTSFLNLDNPFLIQYTEELLSQYYARNRQLIKATDMQQHDLIAAQMEQVIEDVVRIYLVVLKTQPAQKDIIFDMIRGLDPFLMDAIREVTQKASEIELANLTMPKIRKMASSTNTLPKE